LTRARSVGVHVVVPVLDHLELTRDLLGDLWAQGGYDTITIFDNGSRQATRDWLAEQAKADRIDVVDADGWRLYRMWNEGVRRACQRSPVCDVAILNNDLRLGPRFLASLSATLRADPRLWAVSPTYDGRAVDGVELVGGTYKDGGLAGFAFMVRGEVFGPLGFDEEFEWWFGDDDLVAQIERCGGRAAITGDTWVRHVNGGSQTILGRVPEVYQLLRRDYARMLAKWGHA
jgi:GT2 family glycosyltransferase